MFLNQLPSSIQGIISNAPPISPNALTVLKKRYLDKDDTGALSEDADGAYYRVASTIAQVGCALHAPLASAHEQWTARYFSLLRNNEFFPNSPTIANAGTRTGQLSACFVLPIKDALANGKDGIYDTLQKAQLIFQTGGGCGYYFGDLRSDTEMVETTRGVSSGPLSFMDVYDAACQAIAQGGIRRGAQMGMLGAKHPMIRKFIAYKQDRTKLTNFNVSVSMTNDVLAKLEEDDDSYELVDPHGGPTGKFEHARALFADIVHRAWESGEPGLIFIDRMEKYNPTPWRGGYVATNPCGEQPLNPWESCNLGSMVLDEFLVGISDNYRLVGKPVTYVFDEGRFEDKIIDATTMMDDVVDANKYVPARGHNPGVPEIEEVTKATRKLGLGFMGLARVLFKLGIAYDSPEGRKVAARLYALIDLVAKEASAQLAKERGAYPDFNANWDWSVKFHTSVLEERALRAEEDGFYDLATRYRALIPTVTQYGYRNSTVTTIAPTGTISILADTSGGCEPQFALVISRWQADEKMHEADKFFKQELVDRGCPPSVIKRIFEIVSDNKGSLIKALPVLRASDEIPAAGYELLVEMAKIYVTAGDISPEDHVLMQAALQRYCDSSISKTINFDNDATEDDVRRAYDLAILSGCKGITVYRDGCREFQPLTAGAKPAAKAVESEQKQTEESRTRFVLTSEELLAVAELANKRKPRTRSERLYGLTDRLETGDGRLYINVNYDQEGPREVFVEVGRAGGVLNGLTEAIGRLVSLALKHRVPVEAVASMLIGIRSVNTIGFGPRQILSIPDAIGRVLKQAPKSLFAAVEEDEDYVLQATDEVGPVIAPAEELPTKHNNVVQYGESPECPQCGSPMKFESGCRGGTCSNDSCGFAKC